MRMQVAPHAGAWIETMITRSASISFWSPPTRGRGLKRAHRCQALAAQQVAPHAGAWIETGVSGATTRYAESPPTRGRGLKHSISSRV